MNVDPADSPAAGPGPDRPSPASHVEPDKLADLAEGLLSHAEAETVRTHLADCESCAADYSLITESFDLAALLPPEPIPAEVVARVTAALEREPALGSAAVPTVGPDRAPGPARRPARRRGFKLVFGTLGAALALGAVVVGGVSVLTSSGEQKSTASGAMAAAPDTARNNAAPGTVPAVDDTAAAQQAATRLLQSKSSTAAAPDLGMAGGANQGFASCLAGIPATQAPLGAEQVDFRGQPAWLLVYRQAADPTRADVVVVPQSCLGTGSVRPNAASAASPPLLATTVKIP